jgi:hypothetical protein
LWRIAGRGELGDALRLALVSADAVEGVSVDDDGDGFHLGTAVQVLCSIMPYLEDGVRKRENAVWVLCPNVL